MKNFLLKDKKLKIQNQKWKTFDSDLYRPVLVRTERKVINLDFLIFFAETCNHDLIWYDNVSHLFSYRTLSLKWEKLCEHNKYLNYNIRLVQSWKQLLVAQGWKQFELKSGCFWVTVTTVWKTGETGDIHANPWISEVSGVGWGVLFN